MTLQEPSRLILVHGWCGSAEAWAPITNLLAEYADLRTVALRLPGSPGSRSHGPFSVAGAADLVVEEISAMDQPATLIGHSMGAQVTLLAHTRVPELVSSEIVVDPAYGAEDDELGAMQEWAERIESSGHTEVERFFSEAFTPALPARSRERIISDLLATEPHVIAEYLRSEYVDADSIGLKTAVTRVAAGRTRPVLALHSTSRGADFEAGLGAPVGSQVDLWSGHGHYLHLEDPARFVARVMQWLDNTSQRNSDNKDGLELGVTR